MGCIVSIGDFFRRMYVSASTEQTQINRLFDYFLIMSLIIVIIVAVMVLYGGFRFRARKQDSEREPEQISGNRNLEIVWTVLPFLTLVFFFYLTLKIMKVIDRPPENQDKPDIEVITHQFWWEFRYPAAGMITANEMHIPVGKNLLLRMTSSDVIHNWWVMELGRKMDAIPGRFNFLWIQADRTGTFLGTCGEYCGAQHAWMRIYVEVQDSADYARWLEHQKQDFIPGNDSLVNAGINLFERKTCSNCHAIRGTRAKSLVGPDLTHLISRKTLVAGVLDNNRKNLMEWLKDPQRIKPGSRMPNLILSPEELDLMLKFMEELK